jgi:hypothetical protein
VLELSVLKLSIRESIDPAPSPDGAPTEKGCHAMVIQIVGLVVIAGLVAFLVMNRKKNPASPTRKAS